MPLPQDDAQRGRKGNEVAMEWISKKTLSAIILLIFFIPLVVWGPAWSILIVLIAAVGLALHEFYEMTLPVGRRDDKWLPIAIGVAFPLIFFLNPESPGDLILAVSVVFLVILAFGLFTHLHEEDLRGALSHMAVLAFGIFYVGFLGSFVIALRGLEGEMQVRWLPFLFLVTWGGDTGAYFVGKYLGKRHIVPAISPNKTLEGFVGGFFTSVALSLVARGTFVQELSWATALWLGVGIGILGPIGDLIESMMKRGAAVKDTSTLIPGHGGLMDRTDSIFFVAPFVFFTAKVLTGSGL
ncbi:MAG: phosphatidate cytidylyltransferase [Deltaproteobacteria bacterium]|nr:MAG: phosphatidate cytidylyltransferase [Deltaproteobacteria bacterium]